MFECLRHGFQTGQKVFGTASKLFVTESEPVRKLLWNNSEPFREPLIHPIHPNAEQFRTCSEPVSNLLRFRTVLNCVSIPSSWKWLRTGSGPTILCAQHHSTWPNECLTRNPKRVGHRVLALPTRKQSRSHQAEKGKNRRRSQTNRGEHIRSSASVGFSLSTLDLMGIQRSRSPKVTSRLRHSTAVRAKQHLAHGSEEEGA